MSDDDALQQPIIERNDEAYQVLANEAGRRVWTVLQNLIEVRSRKTNGVIDGEGMPAILLGAMSGIAKIVARMDIRAPEGAEVEPEIALLNDFANVYLNTIEQMRQEDDIAKVIYATREAADQVAS